MRGRRARDRDAEVANASLRAEMRNAWSDGARWTVAQMLGEDPPPTAAPGNNNLGALTALEQEAADRRDAKALEEADGWADALDAAVELDDGAVPSLDEVH